MPYEKEANVSLGHFDPNTGGNAICQSIVYSC